MGVGGHTKLFTHTLCNLQIAVGGKSILVKALDVLWMSSCTKGIALSALSQTWRRRGLMLSVKVEAV